MRYWSSRRAVLDKLTPPLIAQAAVRNRSTSRREQFPELGIDEGDVNRIGPRAARKMPPYRRHRHELGVRHVRDLELAVRGREIEIGLSRHHIGPGLDGAERRLEIALVD